MKRTRAVDIDCPKCRMPAGTYCNSADLCQSRISEASRVTRDANRAAKRTATGGFLPNGLVP